jgi:cysteine desulfurase
MNFSTLGAKTRGGSLIYLDHNATTPVAASVCAMLPEWLEQWGNPSSIHQAGRGPKTLLRQARDQIALMLGTKPLELIFTSGGSEANNQAIKGVFESFQRPQVLEKWQKPFRNHYLFSSVEHPSVMRTAQYLEERGARVDYIEVDRNGLINMDQYRALLSEQTALVSVMLANNETGSVFPVQEMAKMAHAQGALFHTDGVQALGKLSFNLRDLDVDLATFAGHKFYALKGCGVLYMRRGLNLESLIHGGGQERHRRGGTENLLAIASLGHMCKERDQVSGRAATLLQMRDYLERRLLSEIPEVEVTGALGPRLPNTTSLVIAGVDGETLLMNLDMRGFAVSTGAACSSGSPEPSPVLLAMGLSRKEAQSSLRLGLGWGTTLQELDCLIEALKETVSHLRALQLKDHLQVSQGDEQSPLIIEQEHHERV